MLFNCFQFAAFMCGVFGLYRALSHRWQNVMLLIASYVFYGAWDYRFLSLIAISTLVDYACGWGVYVVRRPAWRKALVAASVTVNLGLLGFFKYYGFFSHELAHLLSLFGIHLSVSTLNVILPVGISFYTFQTIGYTVDIYRNRFQPTRNLIDFALYVAFFPQLVAGPIERASRLLPQIQKPRRVTYSQVGKGAALILYGLFLKVTVADNLAQVVDAAYSNVKVLGGAQALLAMYGFSFQIFADFAGYTSIARGLAACMGFELVENFRGPYFAESPSDFWKRWHVSLSSWLRDYLYIPLGGNRRGSGRRTVNVMTTMFLGGLWHGAAWTFIAWGAFHGLLLVIWRFCEREFKVVGNFLKGKAGRRLARIVMFHLVIAGWTLFRAENFGDVTGIWHALGSGWRDMNLPLLREWVIRVAPLSACVMLMQYAQWRTDDPMPIQRLPVGMRALIYLGLFYGIVVFGVNDAQSFIYFQF